MKYNHYTIESLICTICHFDNKLELLHHKKLGQFLGNIPVIAGENKAGTIFSCSWGKTVLYQGFDLGIYFPALAGNVPSYSMEYYQSSKSFYQSDVVKNQT